MGNLEDARKSIDSVDAQMAALFAKRMEAVAHVAAYKAAHELPITDSRRENDVVSRNAQLVNEAIRPYYERFLGETIAVSHQYQADLARAAHAGDIRMELGVESYDIIVERGCLARASELLALDRRVLVVTDDGVPAAYAAAVTDASACPTVVVLSQGEESKSLETLRDLLETMLAAGFTRDDCVVAVGGGMVNDVAGFAAAIYLRGIDFYAVPTTLLAQVDASIGGKTAVNLDGVKNVVGAFAQPKRVLVDPDVLATLPARHRANGMAEVLKMAATCDAGLFSHIEGGVAEEALLNIIRQAILIKKRIVEQDVRDKGLRHVLNFGHTLGHGIEAAARGTLLHGESVALGMLPMCGEAVRDRMRRALQANGLPVACSVDSEEALAAIAHDKKAFADGTWVVRVDEIGSFRFDAVTPDELAAALALVNEEATE